MKLHTISLLLLGLLLSSLSIHQAAAQNNALNFNGTNNFVTFPYSPALDLVDGTIEFWMRPDWVPGSVGQNPCILAYRTALGTRFSLHVQADLSGVGIWNGISYQVRPFPFVQGTWYHVALVESGNSTTFYVNGVSIGTTANGFNTSVVNAPLTVGWSNVPSQTQEYFRGDIDEVRIWNTLRTLTEINANRNTEINPQQTGLVAYYRFNQGAAGGSNAGINRLIDLAACTTGTLNNFALSGTASNWVGATNGLSLAAPFGGNNTLSFNGVNNFVTFPYSPSLDLVDGTIEFWIRPNWAPGSNGQNPCVLGYRAGLSATRFSVHLQDDLSGIGIWNGISYLVRPFTFVQGTWYHVAVVESGTSTTFYVNGVSIGSTANGFNTSVSNAPLTIGWSNDPSFPEEYFTGDIDEVRIWNTVRTPAQIAANLNSEINLPQAGLVAYYRFNQGVADGNNAAFNTLNDLVSCNIGTLNNFALSGNTSNWVASTQPLCAGSSIDVATVAARGNGNLISNGSTTFNTANFTDMGTVTLGNTITRTFDIRNTGTAMLTVNNISFTGANAANFTLPTPPTFPVNIAPGTSLSVDVRAQPTVSSLNSTATLNIANNSCVNTFTFNLRATATPSGAIGMNRSAGTNVNLGSPIPLRIDREVTIEAWVNPGNPAIGSGAINTLLANKLTGSSNDGFAFYINNFSNTSNDNRLVFESKGKSVYTMPNAITPGIWQHIAVTVNAATQSVSFYVNGVLQTNDAGNPNNGVELTEVANNLRIGAFSDLAYPFTGAMDEVRLWNRVLSQTEIAANANRVLTGQECNLMAYWNFDEASGSAINDATIAANHGTLAGGFTRVPSGADIRGFAAVPAACTTTWNGTVWTGGRPTSNTATVIAGNYSTQLHGNLLGSTLTINTAGTLTIHPQGRVVATGALTNNGTINNCGSGTLTFGSFSGNPVLLPPTQPTTAASAMTVLITTTNGLSLSWTNGNGQKRIVVLKPNSPIAANAATDNVVYTANTNFSLADTINGTGRVVFNGTGNSVIVTNLIPNTLYYVAVFEYNETLCGVNYNNAGAQTQRMTLPNPPLALPALPITSQGFTARWQSAGTTGYLLEVSTSDNFSTTVFFGQINGLTHALSNIAQNSTSRVFFYRLRAINTSGQSGFSNTIRVALAPATPVALAATNIKSNSFMARWNAATGAEQYVVEVARDSAFNQIVATLNTTSTEITVTGLTENTTYFYRVRATAPNVLSEYSNVISLKTLFNPPVALEADEITPGGFMAKWENYPITDAIIELEVARNDNFSDILLRRQLRNQTTFSVSGLTIAPTYFYRLRANIGGVLSQYSNTISVNVIPATPVAIDAGNVNPNGFTARWETARGADSYRFDLASDSAFTNMIQSDISVNALERLININNPAIAYYYRVRGENARGKSPNSNVIAVFLPPTVPTLLRRESSANPLEITLAWNAAQSARRPVEYVVELATNSNFSGMQTRRTTNLRATFNGQAGLRHFARVKALHDRGESAYSQAISFVLPPAAPSGIRISDVTENSLVLNWPSVQGALSYRVEVNGNIVQTIDGTSTEVTGLQSLQRHAIRISATNEGGNSAWSDAVSTTTLPIPITALPSPNIEPRRFTATWNESAQSGTYILEVSANEGFTSFLAGYPRTISSSTEATVELPNAGGVYFYRVRVSANVSGQNLVSRPSAAQRVSILTTPAALKAENVTATGFDLSWNAVADAQRYEVQISINNFTTILREQAVNWPSVALNGLEANREYQIRVRALATPRSVSEWGELKQFTLPTAPQEAFIRRISTRRATEIGWSYDRVPFERVSNLRFVVERSDNVGAPFRAVSNEISLPANRQFVFEDVTGTQRLQASYRLRIINAAGSIFYELGQRIITSLEAEVTPVSSELQVYPNPSNGLFMLQGTLPVAGEAEIIISDMQGRVISRQSISGRQMSETIDLQQVSTGIYLLQIRLADGSIRTEKLVKE